MNRFIKIIAGLLAMSILPGCEQSQTNSSDSETSLTSESTSDRAVSSTETVETEKIIKLLEDYSDFYLAMTPSENEKFIDRSRNISINGTNSFGDPYTAEYYKTVGLPANTLDELNEKLDGFVTEKAKDDFLNMTNDKFFTVADNGDLYMSAESFGRGLGLGMDKLYLDSIEYPDDNTILVTVTSFGDKKNWDTDEDIKDTATAKLVRTDDGLRISECDSNMIDYFGYYDEISFDEIPQ